MTPCAPQKCPETQNTMKITPTSPAAALGALVSLIGASSSLPAAVYNFGSANDGLAGFTQSTGGVNEIWSTTAGSVQYRNQDPGTLNSSFLGQIPLDRSAGNSYRIQGLVTLTDGYADDNNRVGLYLFGDSAMVPNEDEAGAIGLIFNTDDGVTGGSPGNDDRDYIQLREGIDFIPVFAQQLRNQTTTPFAQDLFGTTVTLTAEIAFTNVGTIEILASLVDADGDVTSTVGTTVSVTAADYTGDYFGFVTRARARTILTDPSGPRGAPWVMDYESFSVTTIPEPATTSLLGAMTGLLIFRRRRSAI
jgi:hypothetical protein